MGWWAPPLEPIIFHFSYWPRLRYDIPCHAEFKCGGYFDLEFLAWHLLITSRALRKMIDELMTKSTLVLPSSTCIYWIISVTPGFTAHRHTTDWIFEITGYPFISVNHLNS